MVLGQCMETMRANQRTIARGLNTAVPEGGRFDTREAKKSLGIVPFRHSKLTEVLMDYFIGEGRVVSTTRSLLFVLRGDDEILGHDRERQSLCYRL